MKKCKKIFLKINFLIYFNVINFYRREVKQNTKRLKKEFMDIRTQRYQEYANYCIFISSK